MSSYMVEAKSRADLRSLALAIREALHMIAHRKAVTA